MRALVLSLLTALPAWAGEVPSAALVAPNPAADRLATFELPVLQYREQKGALNSQGIYLVGHAIECAAPDATDTVRPDCPPQGEQLNEIGWWFSRSRVLALATKMDNQEREIVRLRETPPLQVMGSQAGFWSNAKWFGFGIVGGLILAGGTALALALR